MYERVVVPLDGSERSERALPQAVDFAVVAGTPLHLVHVVDIAPFDAHGTRSPEVLDGLPELAAAEAAAERYLNEAGRRCAALGAGVRIEVRRGWVVDELLRALGPSDLLVIAASTRDRVERAIFGSVTQAILERSPVPVVVVPARAG